VFGEMAGKPAAAQTLVVAGSLLTVVGAVAIGLAETPLTEKTALAEAIKRECRRYRLNEDRLHASLRGDDPLERDSPPRSRPEFLVIVLAIGVFLWLASLAQRPLVSLNLPWLMMLSAATLAILAVSGFLLWRRTRFS